MVEYTELDPTLASAINQETGRLRFCWSNVQAAVSLSDLILLSIFKYNFMLLMI